MIRMPTAIILLGICLPIVLSVKCNATHYDFTGVYSLGKQDELNRTFTKINEKFPVLPNSTYNATDTTSYTIFNVKTTFFYRDSNQSAHVAGNDTIIVEGGRLEADLSFEWRRSSLTLNRSGTAEASGLSDMIVFAKQAIIGDDEGSFISYTLIDASQVTWSEGEVYKLTRVDPATVTDEDKAAITRLLNNIVNVTTVRLLVEQELDKSFRYYLNNSLHDQHQPIDNHFDYIWKRSGKPDVTVPFTRRAIAIDLEPNGLNLRYEVQAAGASNWTCGDRDIPLLHLSEK